VSKVHRILPAEREGVIERLTETLSEHPDIEFAYAYGSFLEDTGFRDIDVAIWTTAAAAARLDIDLGITLTSVTGYPVDVRSVNQAPIPFLFHVLRGQPLLVRDERHLANLIESTARTYHDRAPLSRQAVREAFGG
jgi:uncharacterized protein